MVEIRYTKHLELRLRVRNIPYEYPKLILKSADKIFFDVIEKKEIGIKRLKYNHKVRNMMIAYERKDDYIEIVTIHPISDEKIINRILNGRWK